MARIAVHLLSARGASAVVASVPRTLDPGSGEPCGKGQGFLSLQGREHMSVLPPPLPHKWMDRPPPQDHLCRWGLPKRKGA